MQPKLDSLLFNSLQDTVESIVKGYKTHQGQRPKTRQVQSPFEPLKLRKNSAYA
jgi:hypothetical protein